MDPTIARRTWRTLEPLHGMIYFSSEAAAAFDALGLVGRMGYFGSRSAPMGAVGAEVVIATFYNFRPELVRASIPAAWERATPEQIIAARLQAADGALRRYLADALGTPELAEAAALARRAAETACAHVEGRPLFAGHASLPWPDEDHLVLWHAQTLLREFRGDGHVALLLTAGLDGLGALITHSATGVIPAEALRTSRGWSEQEWDAGVERVRDQGWLAEDSTLNEEGRRRRRSIEDRTDELSVFPYEAIGEDGCARLRELAGPLSAAIVNGDINYPAALATRYAEAD